MMYNGRTVAVTLSAFCATCPPTSVKLLTSIKRAVGADIITQVCTLVNSVSEVIRLMDTIANYFFNFLHKS